MKGRAYCYYHTRLRVRRLAMAKAQVDNKPWRLDLPPLEDMYAVQSAISHVLEALASDALDRKIGALILYGLQQAGNNLRLPVWGSDSRYFLHDYDDGRVDSYPGLEAEFGLPGKIDLDAAPEVAFPRPPRPDPATIFPPKKPPVDLQGLKIWKKVLAEAEQTLKKSS